MNILLIDAAVIGRLFFLTKIYVNVCEYSQLQMFTNVVKMIMTISLIGAVCPFEAYQENSC